MTLLPQPANEPAPSAQVESTGAQADYVAWKDWRAEVFATFSPREGLYFSWHVTRALGTTGSALQVLEIGFGNGGFMGWARQQGHAVCGVEISQPLVAYAKSAGFAAFTSTNALDPAARFDLVVAFDVLEHIPLHEITSLLSSLADRLAPGGRIVLRFPNTESPFGQWYQNGDVTHITALGLSRLRQLAPHSGLRLFHSGERLPWHLEPWPGRVPAGVYRLLRRLFERLLRKMYRLDRSLDFSTNQLVVLGRDRPGANRTRAP